MAIRSLLPMSTPFIQASDGTLLYRFLESGLVVESISALFHSDRGLLPSRRWLVVDAPHIASREIFGSAVSSRHLRIHEPWPLQINELGTMIGYYGVVRYD
jgi:hypothetical protein